MKQRKWNPRANAKIVLEGIKGRPVAEICNEHQICHSQYYQWRDQFLSNLDRVFDAPQKVSRETRLESEIKNLRALVGELTLELKNRRAFLMRKPSIKIFMRNEAILRKIEILKTEHPFWGYRRIWAHLNFIDKMLVNKKRVLRLMKRHHLIVNKDTKLKAKRTPDKPKPRAERPNEIYGIDTTKVKLEHEGWAYLVLVIDWYTKKIIGHTLDVRSKSSHWLSALNQAACLQCPDETRGKGLKLVSDNGCQPTSVAFMKATSLMGIEQIFTSYNNPKGNADTERVFRTLKEEIIWTREYQSLSQLEQSVNDWISYYNSLYIHSSLGYKPPA